MYKYFGNPLIPLSFPGLFPFHSLHRRATPRQSPPRVCFRSRRGLPSRLHLSTLSRHPICFNKCRKGPRVCFNSAAAPADERPRNGRERGGGFEDRKVAFREMNIPFPDLFFSGGRGREERGGGKHPKNRARKNGNSFGKPPPTRRSPVIDTTMQIILNKHGREKVRPIGLRADEQQPNSSAPHPKKKKKPQQKRDFSPLLRSQPPGFTQGLRAYFMGRKVCFGRGSGAQSCPPRPPPDPDWKDPVLPAQPARKKPTDSPRSSVPGFPAAAAAASSIFSGVRWESRRAR